MDKLGSVWEKKKQKSVLGSIAQKLAFDDDDDDDDDDREK